MWEQCIDHIHWRDQKTARENCEFWRSSQASGRSSPGGPFCRLNRGWELLKCHSMMEGVTDSSQRWKWTSWMLCQCLRNDALRRCQTLWGCRTCSSISSPSISWSGMRTVLFGNPLEEAHDPSGRNFILLHFHLNWDYWIGYVQELIKYSIFILLIVSLAIR